MALAAAPAASTRAMPVYAGAPATPLAERILLVVLFVTVLASSSPSSNPPRMTL